MAARADIAAGKAHVELYVKNSALVKGLRAAQQSLQGLGTQIASIGAGMTAMGAAIVAPIAGALTHFMKFGSELNDLAQRTGVTASSLAELKFAAEQSGASLADIEAALRNMAKKGLGNDIDKQAARIAAIQDPAKRAQAAMETFGKAGTKLLPMLENLQALRKEAQDAGLVPSNEAVSVADALGDAFDKVRSQAMAALFEIGAAVGPVLLPALKIVTNMATATIRWIRENQVLVRTVAAVGAGLVAAGAAVTAIGVIIFGAGSALGVASGALTALATGLGFLLSPLGIVVASLAAGTVYWLRFTASGKAAAAGVSGALKPLLEDVKKAIGGIGDALLAGDLQLAGKIAVTGLKLIFAEALDSIANLIGGTLGAAIGDIGTRLLKGDLQGAWKTTVLAMGKLWADLSQGIVGLMTNAARMVIDVWKKAVKGIAHMIIAAGLVDTKTAEANAAKLRENEIQALMRSAGNARQAAERARASGETAPGKRAEDWEARAREFDTRIAALKRGDADQLGGLDDVVGQMADPLKKFLDAIDADMANNAGAADRGLVNRVGQGPVENPELARLRAERDALLAEAAAAKKRLQENAEAKQRPRDFADDASEAKNTILAGFSSAALVAQLGTGGSGPQQQMVSHLYSIKGLMDRNNTLLEQIKDRPSGGFRA